MKPGLQSATIWLDDLLSSSFAVLLKRLPALLLGLLLPGLLLPGLLLLTGCTPWLNTLNPSTATPLEFRIRQVASTNRPGLYAVAGETSLPSKTRITVTALRALSQSGVQPDSQTPAQVLPNFAILDRQVAEVRQGKWQAELNLWQVASDGAFQEVWQSNQTKLDVRFQPQPEVTFLAMLEPAHQPTELKPELEKLGNSPRASLVQYTSEGEPYLRASQTMAVALPTGKTIPPVAPEQPESTGRAIKATPATEQEGEPWKQTSMPITPEAFLR